MKITTTKKPGGTCVICGKPLVPGTPGTNFSHRSGISRGHVPCVTALRTEQIVKQKETEPERDAERARRAEQYARRYGTK